MRSTIASALAIVMQLFLQFQSGQGIDGCDLLVDGCCAPKVLIIGAMKCGTNAIMGYLAKHPAFKDTWTKHEVHYFSRGVPDNAEHTSLQGKRFYLSRMTCRRPGDNQMVVDKSPSYLNDPSIAVKARDMMPNAKVLAVLCNPAERLWKQWWHDLRHYQPQECREVSSSLSKARESFNSHFRNSMRNFKDGPSNPVARGLYGQHLESWRNTFGAGNVLAVDSGALEQNPFDTITDVLRFLDLDPQLYEADKETLATKVYESAHPTLHPVAARELSEFYASDSAHLASIIGEEWPMKWFEIDEPSRNATHETELLHQACKKPRTGLSMFARGSVKRKTVRAPMPLENHDDQVMDVSGHTRAELRDLSFRDGQLVKMCHASGSPCKHFTAKVRFSPVAPHSRQQTDKAVLPGSGKPVGKKILSHEVVHLH
mmetsp:Transcript_5902/g.16535  ORF Transcript_5902/g.16535 Transcript_5902/m.16535 type:complete len:428 (-) Transcript_5902:188-1471(-)